MSDINLTRVSTAESEPSVTIECLVLHYSQYNSPVHRVQPPSLYRAGLSYSTSRSGNTISVHCLVLWSHAGATDHSMSTPPSCTSVTCIVPWSHAGVSNRDVTPYTMISAAVLDIVLRPLNSAYVQHIVPRHFMYMSRYINVKTCFGT